MMTFFKPLTLLLLSVVAFSLSVKAQKTHVFVDTVKTTLRVDYSPDTIPVYFKELVIIEHDRTTLNGYQHLEPNAIYEKWNSGFVIWQTYRKPVDAGLIFKWDDDNIITTTQYYALPYESSPLAEGKFLYADKKPVTNKVIFSIKR